MCEICADEVCDICADEVCDRLDKIDWALLDRAPDASSAKDR